jgi:hypothetical protein
MLAWKAHPHLHLHNTLICGLLGWVSAGNLHATLTGSKLEVSITWVLVGMQVFRLSAMFTTLPARQLIWTRSCSGALAPAVWPSSGELAQQV